MTTGPNSGEFRLLLSPDGEVVAPDLTAPLLSIMRGLRPNDLLNDAVEECAVVIPRLIAARHAVGIVPSLLDQSIASARRLISLCTLCEHRCPVDRTAGQIGVCQLGSTLSVSAYSMLYNEGVYVGQPTFGVYLRGCSLRCTFCYRPKDLRPRGTSIMSALDLAKVLDNAADAGARSWHFLGGNPDESLLGVLEALRLTKRTLPVVWNSALYMTPEALDLLMGVVDIWLPDYKFGNDECAMHIGRIRNYSTVIRRNLLVLRDEPFLVVRHMSYPGHEECCALPVRRWISEYLPLATIHELKYHTPPSSRHI